MPPLINLPPPGPIAPGLEGKAAGSGPGVQGIGNDGPGVAGNSQSGAGVFGTSISGPGVWASGSSGPGLFAQAITGPGVFAQAATPLAHAIEAHQLFNFPPGPAGTALATAGAAIFAESKSGYAGNFVGKVLVDGELACTGNITASNVMASDVILTGADCAEYFDTAEQEPLEAGTVMILGEAGSLKKSSSAYDKRVAGVVSGAGHYKPGVILGYEIPNGNARPIALTGRVFCKVDARYGEIEMGDLLTTSDTPGHAMRAADSTRAFGTVLGKAMGSLKGGCGLIPILVGLL